MDRGHILFDGWTGVVNVFALATLGYVTLLLLLRVAGKRTIAKMNVFDFIIVVALGSTLGNTALSSSISLAEGATAMVALIGLQYVFSVAALHSERMDQLINGEPALLVRDGHLLYAAMRRERVSREEVLAAIRTCGVTDVSDVEALVLETDGTFSVLRRHREASYSSLQDVPGYEAPPGPAGPDLPSSDPPRQTRHSADPL